MCLGAGGGGGEALVNFSSKTSWFPLFQVKINLGLATKVRFCYVAGSVKVRSWKRTWLGLTGNRTLSFATDRSQRFIHWVNLANRRAGHCEFVIYPMEMTWMEIYEWNHIVIAKVEQCNSCCHGNKVPGWQISGYFKLHWSYSISFNLSNFVGLYPKGSYLSLEKETDNFCIVFTYSIKRAREKKNGNGTAEKCTKKLHADAKLLFCSYKPIDFFPFSLPSPLL